ncbi:Hematopoietically-expressed homeobox protein HHEX [Aphelenchoides fujianensis]|nr:Hematopoietically-expressed homeobox protein HHEX [Aphelenchoides fujianensis]
MHQELRTEQNEEVQLQRRGFSISNLLAPHLKAIPPPDQPPDLTVAADDEEGGTEDSTGRDSSISTDQPEDDDPLFGSEGMLTSFSPLFVQQLAQNAAASLAMHPRMVDGSTAAANEPAGSLPSSQSTPKTSDHSPRSHPNAPQSSVGPANGSPEWLNAMNYLNMANRQLQFMSNNPAGWDPRLAWLQPYLPKAQQKRKGGQIRFTNEQTDALEHMFDNNKYLSNVQRRKLAKSLSLSERQVKTWFQNRRAKWRRVRKDGEDEDDLGHGILNASTPTGAHEPSGSNPLATIRGSPNGTPPIGNAPSAAVLSAAAAALVQRGHSADFFGMFHNAAEK